MNTKILRRGSAAAAVLALSLSLAACGEEDEPENAGDTGSTSQSGDSPSDDMSDPMASPSDDMSSDMGGESTEPAGGGEFDAVFGSACSGLPADGEPGSLTGMVTDPVGTAASTNPLLGNLVMAVQAVPGLLDTLNDESAQYTVFAPADDAFKAIPKKTLNSLVKTAAEPDSPLSQVLTHHVLPERIEPDAIAGSTQKPLFGADLMIEGDPAADPDGVTVTDGVATAKVLCGGIPTANATVYVIDTVLTEPVS
jgi:uncharacterized surface protein with fasciclin (FAS1) repeats